MDRFLRALANQGIVIGRGFDAQVGNRVYVRIGGAKCATCVRLTSDAAATIRNAVETTVGSIATKRRVRADDVRNVMEWAVGQYGQPDPMRPLTT
jgi:hypothetical protein